MSRGVCEVCVCEWESVSVCVCVCVAHCVIITQYIIRLKK